MSQLKQAQTTHVAGVRDIQRVLQRYSLPFLQQAK